MNAQFKEIIKFLYQTNTPSISHQLDSKEKAGSETIDYHFHEFEKFSFEARILFNYNSVWQGEHYGWESEVTFFELDLENTYDNDCELVQLTTSEIAEIEEILKSKTDINLY